jgi:serine/threonine-protein kinase HipA
MADRQLHVLMYDASAGVITQNRSGGYRLEYDEDYLAASAPGQPGFLPLSLSLPLTARVHLNKPVRAYLQGLLPDNTATLQAWATRFGVSARNPFALLEHVGEECAGAVRFVRPDRLDAIQDGKITPASDAEVEALIKQLRSDPTGAPVPGVAAGQFSLAGAQSKFSLLRTASGGWAQAAGPHPSTHIVKPVLGDQFMDKELNEHICLTLLRRCGLPAAVSEFLSFGREFAIVVERYDRVPAGGDDPDLYLRVHQEDLCQAMGVPPQDKYRLGVPQIAKLLRTALPSSSRKPVATAFADGLLANWLLGGTDAHAKNYSLLQTPTQARLAPLYDVISYLPYRQRAPRLVQRPGEGDHTRVKMAMAIGGESDALHVTRAGWRDTAGLLGLDDKALIERGLELADLILEELPDVIRDVQDAGVISPMPDELAETVERHLHVCRSTLSGIAPPSPRTRSRG